MYSSIPVGGFSMSTGYQQKSVVRFSGFEGDPAGELRSEGTKVKLQDQPLQILQILVERHGQIVTREELRAKIWPSDTFVDFDHGINNAIKRLGKLWGTLPRGLATSKPFRDAHIGSQDPSTSSPSPLLEQSARLQFFRWKIYPAIQNRNILLTA